MTEEELPSGWAWTTLSQLGRWSGGGTPSKSVAHYWQGDIPWVSPKDMKSPTIADAEDHVTLEAIESSATALVPESTVLMVTRSGILAHSFPVAVTRREVALNQDLKALTPHSGIDAEFVAWVLRRFKQDILDTCSKHGTTVHSVLTGQLQAFGIPLAPANEQRRIVERIDELFSQIEAGEAALARAKRLLARYRQAVLKAAVTGELTRDWRERHQAEIEPATHLLTRILQARREAWEKAELEKLKAKGKPPKDDSWKKKYKAPEPPDTTDLPELPEGWAWASLDAVSYHLTSGSRAWKAFYDKGESTFVMAQNVRPGRYDHSFRQAIDPPSNDPETERTRCRIDDMLITIVGANTGNTCRFDVDSEQHYVCQSVALVRPSLPIWSSYLNLYFLAEDGGRARFDRYIYGAGRPHLSFADLKQTAVAFPSSGELLEIMSRTGAVLADLNAIEVDLQTEERRAAALRQAILSAAFAGKLVPQAPADEPAAELLARIKAERVDETTAPPPSRKKTVVKSQARSSMPLNRRSILCDHLVNILRTNGKEFTAEELYKASKLEIDDFYKQLRDEVALGLIVEDRKRGRLKVAP